MALENCYEIDNHIEWIEKTKIIFNYEKINEKNCRLRIEYLLHSMCNKEVFIISTLIDASIEQLLT